MLKRQQEEEQTDVLAVSLELEKERPEGPHVSDTEDEEEQRATPLIAACRKNKTEVHACVFDKLAANCFVFMA